MIEWRDIDWEKRTLAIFSGLILLLAILIGYIIIPGLKTIKENKQLHSEYLEIDILRDQLAVLRKEELDIIHTRGTIYTDNNVALNTLTQVINNKLKGSRTYISEISQLGLVKREGYTDIFISVAIKGVFKDCVKVLEVLDKSFTSGELVSADFQTEIDRISKKKNLLLRIIVKTSIPEE